VGGLDLRSRHHFGHDLGAASKRGAVILVVVSDLMPDPAAISATYREVVERAPVGADHAPTEDALEVFKARLRHYSDGLTARVMVTAERDWNAEQLRVLADDAIILGGEIVRGLNDCLGAGALNGYVDVTSNRVEAMVESESGEIDNPSDEVVFSGIEAEVDGWLSVVGRHAAVARHGSAAGADVTVREAFATLGAATAMAAFLRQRADELQGKAQQAD
jgi:hypothetical protein